MSDEDDITLRALKIATEDNRALKVAGDQLAIAALRVSTEYDGLHRLRIAVSHWNMAIANEGGRGEHFKGKLE